MASASHTPPRGALSFSATGGNLSGYIFALATNASGGTINASTGAYVAGSTPGVVDVVSVTDTLGNIATSNVAVDAGVSLSPPSRSVAPMGASDLHGFRGQRHRVRLQPGDERVGRLD